MDEIKFSADLLKQQEPLKELTEEQIAAAVTTVDNFLAQAIGDRIGKIYSDLDKDILEHLGVEKKAGEKTYDCIKRAGKELKQEIADLKTKAEQVSDLQREKQELEDKIKAGKGTEAISQKLKDTEDKLADLQKKYKKEVDEWKAKAADNEKKAHMVRVDTEFTKAMVGKTWKPEVSEELREQLMDGAKRRLLSTHTPDFIDDGKGGERLVWRNGEGKIQNNPDNQLNPYTTEELLVRELKPALLIEGGGGTGTKKPNEKGKPEVLVLEAKTQVEADNKIVSYLLAQGLVKGSAEFAEKQKAIREENKVGELPIR